MNPQPSPQEWGLKCGIEIHQQLDTGKLFCVSPSVIRDDAPTFSFTRKLRAVIGETGEIDVAAASETRRDLTFRYEGYHDTISAVECDEEPPRPMNTDALRAVLQVAKMLRCRLVDEVQVMRKTVVNGSNTSGFQRTALVAYGGSVETESGQVGIQTVCIEEDSAKDVEKRLHQVTYNLSRLGIPLIEIATDPDIQSPEQCKEICEHIGMILRSTGRVKRGLGTIRQDLNISITGGARVEIKGAQDLKTVPRWVSYEALRQHNLLGLKEKVPSHAIKEESRDVTDLFASSKSSIIQKALDKKGSVYALRLPGFSGLTGRELQPGRRVGSELSDYAKVYGGVGGIFHTDELPKYGITEEDVLQVKKILSCTDKDAFILVADTKDRCAKALSAVLFRVNLFRKGVVGEVRRPHDDGTSSFMRPIPGRDRMYPETDCMPVRIYDEEIELPELLFAKAERFMSSFGLSRDLAAVVVKEIPDFEERMKAYAHLKPSFVADTVISIDKQIKRKYGVALHVPAERIWEVLGYLDKGKITQEVLIDLLKEDKDIPSVIGKYALLDDAEVEKQVRALVSEHKDKPLNVATGIIIGALRGKANPQKVITLVKNYYS